MTDDEIRASRANVPKAGPDLHGDSVVLRPVAPADVPELGRIARTTEVESRWGDEYLNEDWP
ncbi:MAG: hypothetical protein H0T55_06535, partial [Rubrobacteraceae bacterium]|nr:hypothetical protein [Rubrobacteraceae bacterium]